MRARNIKPSFFTNEILADLTAHERLLFIGLWCLADKDGFFEWRVKRIEAEIFPYEKKLDVEKMLENLIKSNVITCNYIVNTLSPHSQTKIGHVTNFTKHQKPHPHEKKSQFDISVINQCHDNVIPKSDNVALILGMRNEERGMRNEDSPERKPAHQDSHATTPKVSSTKIMTDEEWIGCLKANTSYSHIDIDFEMGRMDAWLSTNPSRKKTRRFVVNWLNKIEKAVATPDAHEIFIRGGA